jgi:SlyX protein
MQEQELIELQTQLAFQEQALGELNTVVTRQQQQIDRLQLELKLLLEKIEAVEGRVELGSTAAAERPPHY